MPSLDAVRLKSILDLLRAGNVQEADDLVTKLMADASAPAPGAPAPAPAPAPPRPAVAIIVDLFNALVAHAGFPPAMQALLDELIAAEL